MHKASLMKLGQAGSDFVHVFFCRLVLGVRFEKVEQAFVVLADIVHYDHIHPLWKALDGMECWHACSFGKKLVAFFAILTNDFDAHGSLSLVFEMTEEQVTALHVRRVREMLV